MNDSDTRTWIAARLRRDGYQARADHRRKCVIVREVTEFQREKLAIQYDFLRIFHPH